jgi:tricorn protease
MVTAALLGVLSLNQITADARLMKFPDIFENIIVFQYGGDLWLVSTEGGVARRITTSPGVETWPKFSPDGKWIAFSADYDGNMDVYVMPSEGGEPKRLTSHPRPDQVLDWSADGKQIIFRSSRESKNAPA